MMKTIPRKKKDQIWQQRELSEIQKNLASCQKDLKWIKEEKAAQKKARENTLSAYIWKNIEICL